MIESKIAAAKLLMNASKENNGYLSEYIQECIFWYIDYSLPLSDHQYAHFYIYLIYVLSITNIITDILCYLN